MKKLIISILNLILIVTAVLFIISLIALPKHGEYRLLENSTTKKYKVEFYSGPRHKWVPAFYVGNKPFEWTDKKAAMEFLEDGTKEFKERGGWSDKITFGSDPEGER